MLLRRMISSHKLISGSVFIALMVIGVVVVQSVRTAEAANNYVIADEGIAPGWVNWSWGSQVIPNDATQMYSGATSLRFTPSSGWAGLYLHSDTVIKTQPYQYLQFSVKSTVSGAPAYQVYVSDGNYRQLPPVQLKSYTPVTSNGWMTYRIPLSDLKAADTTVNGILMQEATGSAQPPIWIDALQLASAAVEPAPISAPASPPVTQPAAPQGPAPFTPAPMQPAASNPFTRPLDVEPGTAAAKQAAFWRQIGWQPGADLINKIASQPQGTWFGEWSGDIQAAVNTRMSAADSRKAMPVLVAYNIPNRDCGSYSAGGVGSVEAYKQWIDRFAAGIGGRPAVVIMEPDALAQIDCLPISGQQARYDMLKHAATKLSAAGATTYIDAGHSGWISADVMVNRLRQAGVATARGFSLNVSGFDYTKDEVAYGRAISNALAGSQFVIDTSRSGRGPDGGNWCNPWGRALGERPTTQTGQPGVDGYLWIKRPGESDGTCNGGASAGSWWLDYAMDLARNSAY